MNSPTIIGAQLRAALLRALLQAVIAACVTYFGSDALLSQAVEEAADITYEATQATTTAVPVLGSTPTSALVTDDPPESLLVQSAANRAETEAKPQRNAMTGVVGLLVLVVRGGIEGIYDQRRQAKGSARRGDVTSPTPSGAGSDRNGDQAAARLRVTVDGSAQVHAVVAARKTSNTGHTEYLIAPDGDTAPTWVPEHEIETWSI